MSLINISICLDKIDKSKVTVGKDGKKYLNLTISKNRETDKFGNTHTVAHSQSKEEREAKVNRVFVGNGKEFVFGNNNSTPAPAPQEKPTLPQSQDDLPF